MTERKVTKANRGFKGIWIPANIWLDQNLTMQEIMFLVEIDSLDISEAGCYASNKHFSEFFGLSKSRVSEVINSLAEKKYIHVTYEFEGKEIKKRVIKVFEKLNRGIRDYEEGYSENAKESNTSFSNTKNNMSSKPDQTPYSEIIDYLNQKTNKSYKTTQKWKDLIKARWNEGQRVDDFKKVIDVKCSQWLNDSNMNKYLRPQTLFGNKFDEYLNEYVPKVESSRISDIERTQRELREVYEQQ